MRQLRSGGAATVAAAAATTSMKKKSGAPALFLCPISLEIMRDPVIVCTGQTYDRPSIEKWIKDGHRSCPITMLQLHDLTLIPNIIVRQLIEAWSAAGDDGDGDPMFAIDDRSMEDCEMWAPEQQLLLDPGGGSREQVLCLLRSIASGGGDVRNAVSRLRSMVRKEERDDISSRSACECIVEAGGALLLASLLADRSYCPSDSRNSPSNSSSSTDSASGSASSASDSACSPKCGGCEEVMALLGTICRGPNARTVVASVSEESGALDAVVAHFIRGGVAAAMLLKRLLAASPEDVRVSVARTPGFFKALLDLIDHGGGGGSGDGIDATVVASRRKSMVKLLQLACSHKPSRSRAVDAGAVVTLLGVLATGGGAANERALAALESLCGVEAGRRAVAGTAVPTVVRMLLGHSRQCTEHATAILLLLCQSGPVETLETAVRAGAGRQLLLLLQSDCTSRAKRKALELLKLFHAICAPGMRISSPESSKNGDVLY